MGDGKPITAEAFFRALWMKVAPPSVYDPDPTAKWVADAITQNGLTDVIAPYCRHDGKPVTFAKGFELVFGERLKLKGAA